MSRNALVDETSPYLRQHMHNPVHWRTWSPAIFAEARDLNRPILLSVGYAACHWCHVMAHESFEDEAIAGLMNELFVPVKVDREERPDVDSLYQTALALMGEHGGWPLTMFLTPDGDAFYGGTYFPPSARYGRPAFTDVLRGISQAYHRDQEKIATNVTKLRSALEKASRPEPGDGITAQTMNEAAALALRLVDPYQGGTAGAPKFPQPVFFNLLWRAYRRTGSVMFRDAVLVTLDNLCDGGIYDHLGGGFARYSTDAVWLVPHFEKMLYDNALLIELLTVVWLETRKSLYATRVAETIGWLLREMRVDDDAAGYAFASALDADSEGVEGKYYVWSEAEIDRVLAADAPLFKAAYDVRPGGNWESHSILNRTFGAASLDADAEPVLARCRDRLLDVRLQRIPPGRDHKVLADWNGMTVAALASAAAVFDEPVWLDTATAVYLSLFRMMNDGERLHHVWCDGVARHPAVLDDYAQLARAGLRLYEATGNMTHVDDACRLVDAMHERFWDDDLGGYFLSAADTTDIILRTKPATDNATPSGNGVMADVLARLYLLTGHDPYRQRLEALVRAFSDTKTQHLLAIPGLLAAWELFVDAVQIVIVGDPETAETRALLRVAHVCPNPLKLIVPVRPGQDLPPAHPAAGKGLVDGRPAAYVCHAQTCQPAVCDAEVLRTNLTSV